MNNKISFVIVSCDRYNDLWPIFFKCFKKYWSDCEFNIYLITNNLQYSNINFPNLEVISIGEDLDYSSNLLSALEHVKEEWLILWLEDCIFKDYINNELVCKIVNNAISTENLGYLKLSDDLPLYYANEDNEDFGIIPKGVKYRSAIGMSLYKKDVLKKLLLPGHNAWELDKSDISDSFHEEFYALNSKYYYNPIFPYINTVIKGKWYRKAVDFLKFEQFEDKIENREVQSYKDFYYIKMFLFIASIYRTFKIYWFRNK